MKKNGLAFTSPFLCYRNNLLSILVGFGQYIAKFPCSHVRFVLYGRGMIFAIIFFQKVVILPISPFEYIRLLSWF